MVEIKHGSAEELEMKRKLKVCEEAIKYHRDMLQKKINEAEGYKRVLDKLKQANNKPDKT